MERGRAGGAWSRSPKAAGRCRHDLPRRAKDPRPRAQMRSRLSAAEEDAARSAVRTSRFLAHSLERAGAGAVLTRHWPFAAPEIHAQSVEIRGARCRRPAPQRSCGPPTQPTSCHNDTMGLYVTAQVPAGLHLVAPGGRERRCWRRARGRSLPAGPAAATAVGRLEWSSFRRAHVTVDSPFSPGLPARRRGGRDLFKRDSAGLSVEAGAHHRSLHRRLVDVMARDIAPKLQEAFKQPFIVETGRAPRGDPEPTLVARRRPTATRCSCAYHARHQRA